LKENPDSELLMTHWAQKIAKRRLATPAIFMLESLKPLSLVGNQLLIFMEPIVKLFVTIKEYPALVKILEERENLEKMIQLIEQEESEILNPQGETDGKG